MITDEKNIKEALKKIANTVTIVTSQYQERRDATTIAWVSKVSNIPPLIMVSISPRRYIHDLISKSEEFNVAVLGDESQELALFCGTKSGHDMDKFREGNIEVLKPAYISAPLIKNALVNIECRLLKTIEAGDHTGFIGEVIASHVLRDGKPLVASDKLCTLDY